MTGGLGTLSGLPASGLPACLLVTAAGALAPRVLAASVTGLGLFGVLI